MKTNSLFALGVRICAFTIFWLTLDGAQPAAILFALPAAAIAGVISLGLIPPSRIRLRWTALLSLGGHFLLGSIVAGVDVALRAFHPRMPLRTGFVTCSCRLPAGLRRDFFLAMASLMPGSLPIEEDANGRIVLHCLDTSQPLAEQLADHEARLIRAIGEEASDA
jgi:multicomponent Na+:H+ antiporter subunit E